MPLYAQAAVFASVYTKSTIRPESSRTARQHDMWVQQAVEGGPQPFAKVGIR